MFLRIVGGTVVCFSLMSCSGGASPETAVENNLPIGGGAAAVTTESSTAFYEQIAQSARSRYSGKRTEEPISLNAAAHTIAILNAGVFPDSSLITDSTNAESEWTAFSLQTLYKLPHFDFSSEPTDDLTIPEKADCSVSGYVTVATHSESESMMSAPEKSAYSYDLTYYDCQSDKSGPIFTGQVDMSFSIGKVPQEFINNGALWYLGLDETSLQYSDIQIIYKDLNVVTDIKRIRVDGGLRWTNPGDCGESGNSTLTALFVDLDSKKEILLDNLTMGFKHHLDVVYCPHPIKQHRDNARLTYFNGDVYTSEFGLISAVTPDINLADDYESPSWNTGFPSDYEVRPYAELELVADNTEAYFIDQIIDSVKNGDDLSSRKLSLWLFDAQGDRMNQRDIASTMFLKGGLLDLDDDDNDGIGNSWEKAAGLDPLDSADAGLDFDQDSVTNHDEFVFAGDPRLAQNPGFEFDMSFSRNSAAEIGYYGDEDSIGVTLYVDGWFHAQLTEQYMVISADVDGVWSPENPVCTTDDDPRIVVCPSQNKQSFAGGFKPNMSGTVNITARLAQHAHDYFSDNNSVTFTVDYP